MLTKDFNHRCVICNYITPLFWDYLNHLVDNNHLDEKQGENIKEVGFLEYWFKPLLYNYLMFQTGFYYRQMLAKEWPGEYAKYIPGVPLIKRRYLVEVKIDEKMSKNQ